MHDFEGDLLIGGMTLRHLHGELEEEGPDYDTGDWRLSGRLQLANDEQQMLQLNRRYRLELIDGRAGQVVISRIEAEAADRVVVEFCPVCGDARSKERR